ncbi:tRNA (adenosine(37)-N6)-threonylcarbamoyltransferase complex ATPase subunit type 1 TsaE [Kingella kingae]|uniref:tRNA (adenosine(37)-N6)-threonylcarbamoyltransferase complex ATPase subunit type 1 TsaE n=1 Tax=Kingella kingae TaxID=504 RepID=UPI000428BB97|nr:tRNA (adenosine(37)-N6)-threonylcarbamoyltransferase complex ATPase subunit type 1 TsaE [Kingella kingae]MDK4574278.1 tRNA (adenosine(37)-N6)-threonylcarbamoyltransferase complex ATPase subunit type 1 TsaE [Kingella kingae]MDK4606397.1 tRNA (adenosine(37)-N6)-threonylcarbamoyltransferase complex ATPase subunit type 1 TsaE [Kingella kingae]
MLHTQFLADESETLALGTSWASSLHAPLVVYLQGDLGAGKTTFTRGLLHGMGHDGAVKSPTYAIVESYPLAQQTVHHFDLYRFATPDEWEDAGLDDLIANSICLIEWAEQGGDYVPAPDLLIQLTHQENGRLCTIKAVSAQGKEALQQWTN